MFEKAVVQNLGIDYEELTKCRSEIRKILNDAPEELLNTELVKCIIEGLML